MNKFQVTRTEQTEAGSIFWMNTGDSVLMTSARAVCRNKAGRGFSSCGRFAHIARAMMAAVARFEKVAA